MGWLGSLLVAVPIAVALAWWPSRGALHRPLARAALAARALAVLALLLVLLDPGLRGRAGPRRPLVLLDRSVSMEAGGRTRDAAAAGAAARGDTLAFGTIGGGEPAGPTLLADVLTGAVGGGREVVVLTDGEVADAASLPADLLARATVELVPRPGGPDLALAGVRAPDRLAAGDTLVVELELLQQGGTMADDEVALLADTVRLAAVRVPAQDGARARLTLVLPWPAGRTGTQWLELVRTGAPDAEPANDRRWLHLTVTPTPGVVVLVTTPDWDGRFLYRTLGEVTATPVRGYIALEPGAWRRMDDLRPVTTAEVLAAARGADLLAVRGDSMPWRSLGRARLWWPATGTPGDWYVASDGPSPLSGALAGTEIDSLPALGAVGAVTPGEEGWVALTARQARRGGAVPIVAGRAGPTGRTAVIGAQGLYRWAFSGGAPEQAWRGIVAGLSGWLLASPPQQGARAVPVARVTPRGRPVRFRWTGPGDPEPLPIRLTGPAGVREDTLRFAGEAAADVVLPVGRYTVAVDGVGAGEVGVEPFSPEFLPGPVTLPARQATAAPAPARRSLRDLLPLFVLAVAGFSTEWVLRRRLGLR